MNFIKIATHQLHSQDFMPTWAHDTELNEMKWKHLISVVKVMWRRFISGKHQKDFYTTVGLSRTIYDLFRFRKLLPPLMECVWQ